MARGDYEVLNGFALVDPDENEDVWRLGEPFGMYLPEYDGMYGIDGCGGRCGTLPGNLTGSARYVIPSEIAMEQYEKDNRFTEENESMANLGDGLVQMIEGLSGFGDLGYTEYLAYGDLNDLREGYPLGMVDIGPEGEYDLQEPGGGYDDSYYQDDMPAPPPDMRDVPPAKTVDQAELADILAQRRQAIADAIKQRNIQTQKVTDLDHQIVNVLNPQYQQALASNDQEAAVKIGGQIRILNLQRAEAVQKALEWAQFQATAAQMAKNVKAQLALNQLYQETLMRQDPQTAAAIAQAYAEIGQVTAQIKQARAQQLAMQQYAQQAQKAQDVAAAVAQDVAAAQQAVDQVQAQATYIAQQYEAAVKQLQALKAKKGAKLIPTSLTDSIPRYKKQLTEVQALLAQATQTLAAKKQAQQMAQPMQPGYGMDPYGGGYAPMPMQYGYGMQGLDGIGDIDALDATVPYCTLYTRDGYGPTCMQATRMELGGLGEEPSKGMRLFTDIITGGAAELSWNEKARTGLDKDVDKIGKTSGFIAKNVTCPVAKNLQASTSQGKGSAGSIAAAFATSALVGLCSTPGKSPLPVPVIVVTEKPLWSRWWFFPAMLALGGVGYGIYRGMKSPRSLQGFGRVRRHRRHGRR